MPRNTRSRSRRRPHASPMPNAHFVLAVITFVLLILCLILYGFVPTAKEALYAGIAGTLVGFLTGKLSNSFGKVPALTPTVEVEHEQHTAATEETEEEDTSDATQQ